MLMRQYQGCITIEQVAHSTQRCRELMVEPYFEQNLQLTHDSFQKNVSDNLSMKERYVTTKAGEQGGLLFFLLMMDSLLLSSVEEAALSLKQKVEKLSSPSSPFKAKISIKCGKKTSAH
jgi:hypothetical protein